MLRERAQAQAQQQVVGAVEEVERELLVAERVVEEGEAQARRGQEKRLRPAQELERGEVREEQGQAPAWSRGHDR